MLPIRHKKSKFFNAVSLMSGLLLLWQNITYAYPALRVPVGDENTYSRLSKALARVPKEFPVIAVVDGKLLLPEGNQLLFLDNAIADRLKKEGIEVLSGENLADENFIQELQGICKRDDPGLKIFLKEHSVLAMSLSRLSFDMSDTQLQNNARTILRDMLGEEIVTRYPGMVETFMPLIMSISSKGEAEDVKHFFGPIKNTSDFLIANRIPLYEMFNYIYRLDQAMEYVLSKTGHEQIAVRPFLRSLDLENVCYRSGELMDYGIGQLLKQWDMLNITDPQKTDIFFSFGFGQNIVFGGTDYLSYAQPDYRERYLRDQVKRDYITIEENLKNNPLWVSLIELLTKKTLVFNGIEYNVQGGRVLKDTSESGEMKGKNPIFKMSLVSAKTGEQKDILCKWTETQNAKYDRIGTGVSRMLGLRTYHTELYGVYVVDGEEYSWDMIEFIPSQLARDVVTPELRDLGLIFAIEYVLSVKDSVMKHILLSDSEKRVFRIDWEYMLDFGSLSNLNLVKVLEGDEKTFLKSLLKRNDGKDIIAEIIAGFDEGMEMIKEDIAREDSGILALIKDNLPTSVYGPIREKLCAQLEGRSSQVIRNELGLMPDCETHLSDTEKQFVTAKNKINELYDLFQSMQYLYKDHVKELKGAVGAFKKRFSKKESQWQETAERLAGYEPGPYVKDVWPVILEAKKGSGYLAQAEIDKLNMMFVAEMSRLKVMTEAIERLILRYPDLAKIRDYKNAQHNLETFGAMFNRAESDFSMLAKIEATIKKISDDLATEKRSQERGRTKTEGYNEAIEQMKTYLQAAVEKTTIGEVYPELVTYFNKKEIGNICLLIMDKALFDSLIKRIGYEEGSTALSIDTGKADVGSLFNPEFREIIADIFDREFVIAILRADEDRDMVAGGLAHEIRHYFQSKEGSDMSSGAGLSLEEYLQLPHEKEAIAEEMRYFRFRGYNNFEEVLKIMAGKTREVTEDWEREYYRSMWQDTADSPSMMGEKLRSCKNSRTSL